MNALGAPVRTQVYHAEKRYNPVLELIETTTWDEVDRLSELFRIMRIADSDILSKTLI